MATKGIDLSKHNGTVDFAKVKSDGIGFVILRAGYGRLASQKDALFETYYSGAKAVGLPVGAYWYSYAMSVEEAIAEADACIECIKGKCFEYPIYFDVEESAQLALGKEKVSAIIKAFCSRLENKGFWAGLYMSASPASNLLDDECRSRFAFWVAHYGVQKPSYSGAYGMWQYSSTGRVSGVTGAVDLDECYADYPKLIKDGGKNGFDKPTPTPQTKQVTLVIDGVKWSGILTKE